VQKPIPKRVCRAGFGPGSKDFSQPRFNAYAYPSDASFGEQKVLPEEAFYSPEKWGSFLEKYEDVTKFKNPELLMTF